VISPKGLTCLKTFFEIDVPGASATEALAINPQGDIVGQCDRPLCRRFLYTGPQCELLEVDVASGSRARDTDHASLTLSLGLILGQPVVSDQLVEHTTTFVGYACVRVHAFISADNHACLR